MREISLSQNTSHIDPNCAPNPDIPKKREGGSKYSAQKRQASSGWEYALTFQLRKKRNIHKNPFYTFK